MTLAKRAMSGVVLIVVIGSSQIQLEPMEWRGREMAQSSGRLTLIKGSIITIDTLQPDDKDGVELSNFMAFEDRETGDIVLPMERWKGGYKGSEPFIYRIGVG